jgi:hypothetical protein
VPEAGNPNPSQKQNAPTEQTAVSTNTQFANTNTAALQSQQQSMMTAKFEAECMAARANAKVICFGVCNKLIST